MLAEAENGQIAVDAVRRFHPQVVLMDIRMPELDGIAATRRALEVNQSVRVVAVTTFDLDEYVYEALLAGTSGFLLKDAPPAELANAVRTASAGDAILSPSVARRTIEEFVRTNRRHQHPPRELNELTAREREVFELIGRGLSNKEIAERLFLGEATVKTHVRSVLRKLELRDRIQAVVLAYEAGIVFPGED